MKGRLGSAAAGAVLALLQVGNASACFEWCGEDPAVNIVTPGGQTVTVNVTDYVRGHEHAAQLPLASFSYDVRPAVVGGQEGTMVHLRDVIPTGKGEPFQTRASVTYGGGLAAQSAGRSGDAMHLTFFVPAK